MHYSLAIRLAKDCNDITYEEWCALYVSFHHPTDEQVRTACTAAHSILVRNHVIESSVVFDQTIRSPQG